MTGLLELLERDTDLRKVGVAEWAGPCPWCGGHDRFRVWPDGDRPRYWCRRCDRRGDAIHYLREREGLSFVQARDAVGGPAEPLRSGSKAPLQRCPTSDPPSEAWQACGRTFVDRAVATLWGPPGARALAYLREARGLRDDTIRKWRLGYHPDRLERPAERWGLEGKPIWLERGIVVPCDVGGVLWSVKVRRPMLSQAAQPDDLGRYIGGPLFGMGKYIGLRGYRPALFGADALRGRDTAVVVEGEFDAIVVDQQAGDLVAPVTMGAADVPIGGDWLIDLCAAQRLLVAYDNDAKGLDVAGRVGLLSSRARVVGWPDGVKDATEMHVRGGDLRSWLQYQLELHAIAPRAHVCTREREQETVPAGSAPDAWDRLLDDAGPLRGPLAAFRAQGCQLNVTGGRVFFGPPSDFVGCAWRDVDDWRAAYSTVLAPHEPTLRELLGRLVLKENVDGDLA